MPKTESTAVTRLIELAHQHSGGSDFDWFKPAPKPETTVVTRRPRRTYALGPLHLVAAFVAGAVAVTVVVFAFDLRPAPAPVEEVAPPPPPPAPAAPPATPIVIELREPEPAPVVEPVEPAPVPVIDPPAPAPAPEAAPAPAPAPTPAPARRRPRPARPRPVPAEPAAAADAAPAVLQVGTKPPCELYVDGRLIGWTPQRNIPLTPGAHTLRLVNAEQGIEREVPVVARPGETVRVIRSFVDEPPQD